MINFLFATQSKYNIHHCTGKLKVCVELKWVYIWSIECGIISSSYTRNEKCLIPVHANVCKDFFSSFFSCIFSCNFFVFFVVFFRSCCWSPVLSLWIVAIISSARGKPICGYMLQTCMFRRVRIVGDLCVIGDFLVNFRWNQHQSLNCVSSNNNILILCLCQRL